MGEQNALVGDLRLSLSSGWRCSDLNPFEWRVAERHDNSFDVLIFAPGERELWKIATVWPWDDDRQVADVAGEGMISEWPKHWMWFLLPNRSQVVF